MVLKTVTWDDVQVGERTWRNRSGESRVYCSLRDLSFVGAVFWIRDPDLLDAALQTRILIKLQDRLNNAYQRFTNYLE